MKADTFEGMTFEEWEAGYGATPFDEWCQHYGYAPDSDKAQTDYRHYLRELAVVVEVFAQDDPAPANRPD